MATRLQSCIETLGRVEAELLQLERAGALLTDGQEQHFRRLTVQRDKLVEERRRLVERGERIAEIGAQTSRTLPGTPVYWEDAAVDMLSAKVLDQHQDSALRSLDAHQAQFTPSAL